MSDDGEKRVGPLLDDADTRIYLAEYNSMSYATGWRAIAVEQEKFRPVAFSEN